MSFTGWGWGSTCRVVEGVFPGASPGCRRCGLCAGSGTGRQVRGEREPGEYEPGEHEPGEHDPGSMNL